ncbi:MAG: 1-deoxy-D-xylulose-5-phosphate reductoisomerase [Muribaculaceae bacterium]|nr:1-deoxy-D-xylulose-5-phosphate reductoisomerase [Muribaculaceae bacterium]
MNRPKRIAVLGATGSIGRQTLDIIERYPNRYEAAILAAGRRVDDLIALAQKYRPRQVVIADESLLPKLRSALEPLGIATAAGARALAESVEGDDIDMVLTATVGYSGLEPTVHAIKAGKDIALANKETLVVAGDLVGRLLKGSKTKIYPVDSEHSAIAQCLQGEDISSVERLLITASGGPFRTWPMERMATATAADALRHPNWSMGAKITIDSATMLNKAFEIIEAHHLFGIDPERIEAVVHPQSIIHSMVEFVDGSVKAQLGVPDMHLPIAYALGEKQRLQGASKHLSLADYTTLTFEHPDVERFPSLGLAHYCLAKRGTSACTVNAANEIAVAAFLNDRIKFTDIYRIIEHTLKVASFVAEPDYDDYVAVNSESRAKAEEYIACL